MRHTICVYQDVTGLNISMQDAALMCIGNSSRQLDDQFRGAPIRYGLSLGDFIKSSAFYQLHAEVAGTVAFPDLMNRDDTWVIQSRCRLRLKTKPFDVR